MYESKTESGRGLTPGSAHFLFSLLRLKCGSNVSFYSLLLALSLQRALSPSRTLHSDQRCLSPDRRAFSDSDTVSNLSPAVMFRSHPTIFSSLPSLPPCVVVGSVTSPEVTLANALEQQQQLQARLLQQQQHQELLYSLSLCAAATTPTAPSLLSLQPTTSATAILFDTVRLAQKQQSLRTPTPTLPTAILPSTILMPAVTTSSDLKPSTPSTSRGSPGTIIKVYEFFRMGS
ncbi:unnamed protein product [Caenorhabditis auriculariae]|uniref:Uncharacterized protein n=1 Tax=Caenorhabditis auriculariae TaxID=2777116 RepID=A0A8S1HYN8_9PELO|nr:unnamed protein product [Caenorhabditis auriculariae]